MLAIFTYFYIYYLQVALIPNTDWGGEGCIGCGIGYGYLHRIPVRPPSSSLYVPRSTTPINQPLTAPIVNTEATNELTEVQLVVPSTPSSPSYTESSAAQNGLESEIAQLAIGTSTSDIKKVDPVPLDVSTETKPLPYLDSSQTNISFSPIVTSSAVSHQFTEVTSVGMSSPIAYAPLIPPAIATPPLQTSNIGPLPSVNLLSSAPPLISLGDTPSLVTNAQ